MKQLFILAHELARKNAMQAVLEAPTGYAVEIRPKNRSLDQNAKIHALIQEISRIVVWAGKLQEVETWKRLLTAAWLRARGEPVEMLPAIDGYGVDVVFRPTSKLTVEEMSEFIEYVQAWAVEQGIQVE
jgi:hypothetical protein